MISLFDRKQMKEAQGFLFKLLNNHCSDLEALFEGPRNDRRVRLNIVVMVTPLRNGRPMFGRTFAAVTKEFSTTGLALIVNELRAIDEVILGFRWEATDMKFLRAKVKHLDPMGAGFFQMGLQAVEVVHSSDYPDLQKMHF